MAFTDADSGRIIDVNAAWLIATGFVRVNSHFGHGTTFELFLPASPREMAIEKFGTENLPPLAHGELILVVDDDAPVRNVIQRTLDKHGYRVVTANEGSEAMAFLPNTAMKSKPSSPT